jgi:hypothetical protein
LNLNDEVIMGEGEENEEDDDDEDENAEFDIGGEDSEGEEEGEEGGEGEEEGAEEEGEEYYSDEYAPIHDGMVPVEDEGNTMDVDRMLQ